MFDFTPGYFVEDFTGIVCRITENMKFEVYNKTNKRWEVDMDYSRVIIGEINFENITEELIANV